MAANEPDSPPTIRGHQGNLSLSMSSNTQIPRTALSPVSVSGSDWSGISKYTSGPGTDSYGSGKPLGALNGSPVPSNVSPPSSIARSSDGVGLFASSEASSKIKNIALEEQVAVHHEALSKWLREFLETKGNIRPNRARDKLLRLSVIQFQELSTDVYDELQRREPNMVGEEVPPPGETPAYLPPKDNFHPKRNQARQKLSTLPADRFRDLATDVFYELERRFPKFSSGLLPPIGSPTNSMDGRGMPPRMGSPAGPGRRGSPGAGMMGRGAGYGPGPGGPYGPNPNGYRGPPPRGPPPSGGPPRGPGGPPNGLGGDPNRPNSFGRPLPKTFQNNTLIPNKSTMVEDDDDGDDDDDMDAFGLEEKRVNGRGSMGHANRRESSRRSNASGMNNEADKKLIADYQSKVELLQDKVIGLEASLEEKDDKLKSLEASIARQHDEKNHEWEELRLELEGKLTDAENLNNSLRSELERVQADSAANERSLRQQLREQQEELDVGLQVGSGAVDDEKYEELSRQHEDLKLELREQEEVTEEVRREAMEFLNQMKVISERADHSFEREEKLNADIKKLQEEIKNWKSRYAKAKTTIRSIRSSSLGLQVPSSGALFGKEGNLVDSRGLIKAVHLTKFQISIDELLKVARGINFGQSLDVVKAVVVATRALLNDIAAENGDEISRIKSRISATANNLTTAAKNHATGYGLSPVSLVDAAASHLTASVIELVKQVKIRPTTEGNLDEEDEYLASATPQIDEEELTLPPGGGSRYLPVGTASSRINGNGHYVPEVVDSGVDKRSSNDSLYSGTSSPHMSLPPNKSRNGSVMLGEKVAIESKNWGHESGMPNTFGATSGSDVEELRLFLENQTNNIVESIQSLLESIKSASSPPELSGQITVISEVVSEVLGSTRGCMKRAPMLRDRGDWIVKNLGSCRERMLEMREQIDEGSVGEEVGKEFKSKLAGLAFDMARETKELVRTVEDIDNEGRRGLGLGLDLSQ